MPNVAAPCSLGGGLWAGEGVAVPRAPLWGWHLPLSRAELESFLRGLGNTGTAHLQSYLLIIYIKRMHK